MWNQFKPELREPPSCSRSPERALYTDRTPMSFETAGRGRRILALWSVPTAGGDEKLVAEAVRPVMAGH